MRNTGSPGGDRRVDQLATRERQAGPFGMAERLVYAVPLDSYTIVAVKYCVELFPHAGTIGKIPKTATMSFVKNQRMYDAFQSGIRKLATRRVCLRLPLIALAWG
jgi:hypothetical protein